MSHETTIPLPMLRGKWPHVPDLAVGEIVVGRFGRRMRVTSTNVWVIGEDHATGPYAQLQALDNCKAWNNPIWPRSWYAKRGESLELFA